MLAELYFGSFMQKCEYLLKKKGKWETWHKTRMLHVSWLLILQIQSIVLIQADVGKNRM